MDNTPFFVWLIDRHLFVPLFVLTWIGGCAALSLIGGWRELGQRFRATTAAAGEAFYFVSGALNIGILPIRYGNCLFVTVGPAGVRISVLFLFRVLHPPLMIPWTAIESATSERFLFWRRVVVRISDFDRRLMLYGRAGEEVAAAHARVAAATSGLNAR